MPQELLQTAQLLTRKLLWFLAIVSPQLVPYIIGFLTAVLAEPLRQRLFRPRLKVEFLNDTNCISWTREGEMRACYLRIKVRNRKWRLARSCRAYLVNVELREANGLFQPTSYYDSMQLAWSAAGDQAFSAIDLPRGLTRFVDVVSTRENSRKFRGQRESAGLSRRGSGPTEAPRPGRYGGLSRGVTMDGEGPRGGWRPSSDPGATSEWGRTAKTSV